MPKRALLLKFTFAGTTLALLLGGNLSSLSFAQNAVNSPEATPPIVGNYGGNAGTSNLEVAPGLRLSADALVWLLGTDGTRQILVPINHQDVNVSNNLGNNIARSAIWLKQRKGIQIPGEKAEQRVHSGEVTLFVQFSKAEEREGSNSSPANRIVYSILQLTANRESRTVGHFEFSRLTGKPALKDSAVESIATPVAESRWLKITPVHPLPPGEYALVQAIPGKGEIGDWVFDFGVDP